MEKKMLEQNRDTQMDYSREIILLLENSIALHKKSIENDEKLIKLIKASVPRKDLIVTYSNLLNLENDEDELRNVVGLYLQKIGIPPNIFGYKYIKEGIVMALENPTMIDKITKTFYPEIANKFSVNSYNVERAIRHAIEMCYKRGDQALLEEIFKGWISEKRGKPSNAEFLACIFEKISREVAS